MDECDLLEDAGNLREAGGAYGEFIGRRRDKDNGAFAAANAPFSHCDSR
jgi:hypothetical protein